MLVADLYPQLQAWRRDFHRYAESGWFEFRTATLVAEELDRLGYHLQLGREVIKAEARMGLPSPAELEAQEQRARNQGRWRNGCRTFPAASPASSQRSIPAAPAQQSPTAWIWTPSISTNCWNPNICRFVKASPLATAA